MSSVRRSFLSRRIIHRSFASSKSYKDFDDNHVDDADKSREKGQQNEKNGIERGEEQDQNDGGAVSWGESEPDTWSSMLPELLGEIMQRVEASEDKWPQRQNVVACGCVCKRWRDATRDVVQKATARKPGLITFPSSLKKAGPSDAPHQCLIKRDKKTATFYLYLALPPSFMDKGKFLLAARRYRNGARTEYVISLDADDISQGSQSYVGKLRSDFLGTNFTIYDSQPPHIGAKPSSRRSVRRVASKQISPQVPSGNFEVGHVSYKFNLLKSRGPRRMVCSLTPPFLEDTSSPYHESHQNDPKPKKTEIPVVPTHTILKNKAPRWHEHLECWCLNFHGRVTVASVKNFQLVATADPSQPDFQLVATADPSQPDGKGDGETVLLQFGKVSDDTFTMDFRQPLSAFQAFAICLTSFGTKLACE